MAFILMSMAADSVGQTVYRTIVLPINFQDQNLAATSEQLEELLFSGPNSVASFIAETSYGNVQLNGEVLDPVTIPFNSDPLSQANVFQWMISAQQTATQAYGTDFDTFNTKTIHVFPPHPNSGVSGATTGGRESWIIGEPLNAVTYAHELGHNFGFAHASAPFVEGGDHSSIMGLPSQPGIGAIENLIGFNLPERSRAGWIPSQRVTGVLEEGLYRLGALETLDGEDPLGYSLPANTDTNYVSFRRPLGFDANLDPVFHDKVFVHNAGNDDTTLLAVLDDGDTYSYSIEGFFTLYVKVVDHNESYATMSFTTSPPVSAPGDFNLDGVVDSADLAQWQGDYGLNAGSDADGDGDSDGRDFLIWQRNFGNGGELVAAHGTVPEPGSLLLAFLAVIGGLRLKLRWRRSVLRVIAVR